MIRIDEYCLRFLEQEKPHLSLREREALKRLVVKYVTPLCDGLTVKDLDDGFRNRLAGALIRQRCPEEKREMLWGLLRDAAEEAANRGLLPYNPFLEIPARTVPGRKYPALTDGEVRTLLGLDCRVPEYACMQVQLLTGMRPAEVRGLCLQDLESDGRHITVRHQLKAGAHPELIQTTKNYRTRRIAPPAAAFRILESARSFRAAPADPSVKDLVFLDASGRALRPEKLLRLLREALGREDVRLHDLRVTHATLLYRATGDLYAVSRRLGHRNTDVTQRHYVDVRPDLSRAAEALNRLGREAGALPAKAKDTA